VTYRLLSILMEVVEQPLGISSDNSQLNFQVLGVSSATLTIFWMQVRKRGRTMRPPWLINGFRRAVFDSGLFDVRVEGYPYTWFKSLGTPRVVEERLDRALGNNLWFNMFPNAIVETLVAPASDHYPILVNVAPIPRPHVHKRHFRYENAWQLEPGFKELVTNSWQNHLASTLMPKLSLCAEDVWERKKNHCHKLKTDIEECRRQMQDTRLQASREDQIHITELRKRMQ